MSRQRNYLCVKSSHNVYCLILLLFILFQTVSSLYFKEVKKFFVTLHHFSLVILVILFV